MTFKRVVPALLLVFALGAASTGSRAQNLPTIQAGDIVIVGGRLFDGVRDTLVPNTGIVVRQGIFLEVGANLNGRDLTAARVVRLADTETILPGFFDLHAHYAIDLF